MWHIMPKYTKILMVPPFDVNKPIYCLPLVSPCTKYILLDKEELVWFEGMDGAIGTEHFLQTHMFVTEQWANL